MLSAFVQFAFAVFWLHCAVKGAPPWLPQAFFGLLTASCFIGGVRALFSIVDRS